VHSTVLSKPSGVLEEYVHSVPYSDDRRYRVDRLTIRKMVEEEEPLCTGNCKTESVALCAKSPLHHAAEAKHSYMILPFVH
jgi:hypothetical protein